MVSGFGNDGASGFEGCRAGRAYGTYLHGPLLPRNPWFADRMLGAALAHATGDEVSSSRSTSSSRRRTRRGARARERGGRYS